MLMTQMEFENEKRYMLLMHQVRRMLESGIISESEFLEISRNYSRKYKPKSGTLLVEKDLLCRKKRVINSVGKEAVENEEDQYS